MKALRYVLVLMALALVGLFAAFIWPTRWMYAHSNIKGERVLIRQDRLHTYHVEVITEKGWRRFQTLKPLPPGDREHLSDTEFNELYKEYKTLKAEYPGIIPVNKQSLLLRRAIIASDFFDRLREEEERRQEEEEEKRNKEE